MGTGEFNAGRGDLQMDKHPIQWEYQATETGIMSGLMAHLGFHAVLTFTMPYLIYANFETITCLKWQSS